MSRPPMMKEAHVDADTHVSIHDAPIPEITEPTHVLVKVVVAACNPKDWKLPSGELTTIADCPNSGDDVSGIVHAVGSAVADFKPGDRVAALHQLGAPFGAYAEYCLVHDYTTIRLADQVTFEQAATVPMISLMATIGLFAMLKVAPGSFQPITKPRPLIVWGAASGVGSMAVKLARLANVHPIIGVAGGGHAFVQSLLDPSKGDAVVDYRQGTEQTTQAITDALKGQKLEYAFDAISIKPTQEGLLQVLDPSSGHITITLPHNRIPVPKGVTSSSVMAGSLWKGLQAISGQDIGTLGLAAGGSDFGYTHTKIIGRMLADGRLEPHPLVVVPGGLNGLEQALQNLRAGKVGALKYVVRIDETFGLQN